MTDEINRATHWPSNAAVIVAARDLGYVNGWVLDPTYGMGAFWTLWRPETLIYSDVDPAKASQGAGVVDFTDMLYSAASFETVVYDPPYGLRGRGDPVFDKRYGTFKYLPWQERHEVMRLGLVECARVLKPGGHLLMKLQNQVCGGKVRWQSIIFTNHAEKIGLELVDQLDLLGHIRRQPEGRRQVHARSNYSSLMIYRKRKPRKGRTIQ